MNLFNPIDYQEWIGRVYQDRYDRYILDGILFREDDWYWVMRSLTNKKKKHLSCLGDPERFGLELVAEPPEDHHWRYNGTHPYLHSPYPKNNC